LVNTGELEAATYVAGRRVLEIQAKLHRWARDDPHRRFDDLFNLVADPAFLLVAWDRVRHNRGAKTAGVDGHSAYYVQAVVGVEEFLDRLRVSLKDRSFCPVPVREQMIPKAGGKKRRLGIGTDDSYCPSCNRVSGCFWIGVDLCWSGPRSRVRRCEHRRWHRHSRRP
jgi:RNA-directed DNA polymerase